MSRIAEQLAPSLFDRPPPAPAYPAGVPTDICDLFERLALQVRDAGLHCYSARAILHRMRWFERVERGNGEFKVNNNYSAALARWFLDRHPELPDFFETRGDDE